MKLLAVVGILAISAAIAISTATSRPNRCATGQVRGFAVVRGDPRLGGIGAIPSQFSSNSQYFEIRYNCTAKGVLAKRVDEGVYDVLFPGNPAKIATVTPLSQQGATASVDQIDDGIFRVVIRGPIVGNDILRPRESPFYIVVV